MKDHLEEDVKSDALRRIARISGQVNGIKKMLEGEQYCVDILTQVSALRAALDQFGLLMLTTHLESCVYGEGNHGNMSETERIQELRVTLNRFLK